MCAINFHYLSMHKRQKCLFILNLKSVRSTLVWLAYRKKLYLPVKITSCDNRREIHKLRFNSKFFFQLWQIIFYLVKSNRKIGPTWRNWNSRNIFMYVRDRGFYLKTHASILIPLFQFLFNFEQIIFLPRKKWPQNFPYLEELK